MIHFIYVKVEGAKYTDYHSWPENAECQLDVNMTRIDVKKNSEKCRHLLWLPNICP